MVGAVLLPAGRVEQTPRESKRVYRREFVGAGVLLQEEWLTSCSLVCEM